MPRKRARLALVLSSLMAATVASTPRVSQADDGPVSETPQPSSPWAAAKMKALDDEAPPPLETSSSTSAYGLELGFAYIATPFLAVGLTGLVLAADPDAGLGGVALAVALASTPAPIVHALNGHGGRALAAGLAAPALFFGGAFVGTLISLAVITAADPIDTPEEQEDGALVHGLTALAIGLCTGLAAYTTWAIFDVSRANRGDARSHSYTRLQLGVVPRRDGASAVLATRF